jgi:hypothetical protein
MIENWSMLTSRKFKLVLILKNENERSVEAMVTGTEEFLEQSLDLVKHHRDCFQSMLATMRQAKVPAH